MVEETEDRLLFVMSAEPAGLRTHDCKTLWGSVDDSFLVRQVRVQARLNQPNARHGKQLLDTRLFGERACRISLQVWEGAY